MKIELAILETQGLKASGLTTLLILSLELTVLLKAAVVASKEQSEIR